MTVEGMVEDKKTYREYIYAMCKDVDMTDSEEATRLAQVLASEAIFYNRLVLKYEDKLMELMTAKDYEVWAEASASEIFQESIDNMADSDFKKFCQDNMDMLLGKEE